MCEGITCPLHILIWPPCTHTGDSSISADTAQQFVHGVLALASERGQFVQQDGTLGRFCGALFVV